MRHVKVNVAKGILSETLALPTSFSHMQKVEIVDEHKAKTSKNPR